MRTASGCAKCREHPRWRCIPAPRSSPQHGSAPQVVNSPGRTCSITAEDCRCRSGRRSAAWVLVAVHVTKFVGVLIEVIIRASWSCWLALDAMHGIFSPEAAQQGSCRPVRWCRLWGLVSVAHDCRRYRKHRYPIVVNATVARWASRFALPLGTVTHHHPQILAWVFPGSCSENVISGGLHHYNLRRLLKIIIGSVQHWLLSRKQLWFLPEVKRI